MGFFTFISQNPTVPIVGMGALIALVSLRSQQHLTRAKHTLDFDKEFKDKYKKTLIAARDVLVAKSWSELRRLGTHGRMSKDDQDEFTVLVEALNIWEGIAIGLKKSVYGEEQLFEAYGSTVVWLYKNTLPFVNARRAENSRLFANFVSLGLRWSVRLSLPLREEERLRQRQEEDLQVKARDLQLLREQIRLEVLSELQIPDLAPRTPRNQRI